MGPGFHPCCLRTKKMILPQKQVKIFEKPLGDRFPGDNSQCGKVGEYRGNKVIFKEDSFLRGTSKCKTKKTWAECNASWAAKKEIYSTQAVETQGSLHLVGTAANENTGLQLLPRLARVHRLIPAIIKPWQVCAGMREGRTLMGDKMDLGFHIITSPSALQSLALQLHLGSCFKNIFMTHPIQKHPHKAKKCFSRTQGALEKAQLPGYRYRVDIRENSPKGEGGEIRVFF